MGDRYFLPGFDAMSDRCEIAGDEFHHLVHVMRSKEGDEITVFDGAGSEAKAQIVTVNHDRAVLRVFTVQRDAPSVTEVIMATAVPKADRFRWLIEKATELGVARLIPLMTARSIVEPGEAKIEKMRLAVIEACKQSGRNQLMEIDSAFSWDEFVRTVIPADMTFVADRQGAPLANVLEACPPADRLVLVVGPEGGLTETELRQAVDAGATCVSLGPRVLRIETAALALAAIFGYFGNWSPTGSRNRTV